MKKAILTSIIVLCAVSVLVVGVYAATVSAASVTSNGTIEFTSVETFVSYTAKAEDMKGAKQEANGNLYTNDVPNSSPTTWEVGETNPFALTSDNSTLTLTFTFKNEGQATVTATATPPTVAADADFTLSGGFNNAGTFTNTTTIAKGATVTFTYTFTIKDLTKNLTGKLEFGTISFKFTT